MTAALALAAALVLPPVLAPLLALAGRQGAARRVRRWGRLRTPYRERP